MPSDPDPVPYRQKESYVDGWKYQCRVDAVEESLLAAHGAQHQPGKECQAGGQQGYDGHFDVLHLIDRLRDDGYLNVIAEDGDHQSAVAGAIEF